MQLYPPRSCSRSGEVGRTLRFTMWPQWNWLGSHRPGDSSRPLPHVSVLFQAREQDVSRIIQALNECLAALPRQQLRRVLGIGVSGQMHGVLFWKTGHGMLGPRVITRCEESRGKRCLESQRWGGRGTRCLVFCVCPDSYRCVSECEQSIHSTSSAH